MYLEATSRTPEVNIDGNKIDIKGECYPEDITAFSEPIIESLNSAIEDNQNLVIEIQLKYFNSSSAKFFFDFFELLEDAATDGKEIYIQWKYRSKDSSIMEAGEDFGEDMENANFELVEIN